MDLTQKLKNAGIWQLLRVVVQAVTQFAYIAIMARLLSKEDFGLMALASSFIGIGTVFSEGGMGASLIQHQNITQKHINAAFQSSFLLGCVIFTIFFFSAPFISEYFNQPELELLIKVSGVNIVLSALSSISISLLQKHFRFKIITAVSTIIIIFSYTLGVIFAFNGAGVWSLVIATLTNTVLSAIVMFYLSPVKLKFKFYLKEWKELFSFGSGVMILATINYFSNSGLNLVLGKIFTPAKLGVFERTNQIKTLPGLHLGNILDTIMFPAMAEIQDEEERLFRTYRHSLGLVNSVLMPVALFLIFFSKEVVLILLGNQWLEAIVPLQIMFVVLPFSSSGRMADSVVRAKGLIYKNVYRKGLYTIVLITTVSLGAYFYGLIGAAVGVTFSFLFNYSIMLILVKSIFKKSIKEIFMKPVLSGLIISLILLPIILLSIFITQYITYNPVLYVFVNSTIIGTLISFIALKRPSILGEYIQETIAILIPKKKKTI